MKCTILHASEGRMRVHICQYRMTSDQADLLDQYLNGLENVIRADVSERSGNAVIRYRGSKEHIARALSVFHYEDCGLSVREHNGRQLTREFEEKLFWHVARRIARQMFLPAPVRHAVCVCRSLPYLKEGAGLLLRGKMEVPLLDTVTIGTSILMKDFSTASSIMFLLGLSEILEDYTHRKSVDDLARTMSLNIDNVWMVSESGQEILVGVNEIREGDLIVVRTSNMIPLDGIVESGEMSVNQSSMTGESAPVHKEKGAAVYAGTVVDEGECRIRVTHTSGSGRYDRIVRMIEESEKLKSQAESRAAHLADSLVPYSFAGTALTWLLTRNVSRAMAVLMVDYSCALKLSMPISVLSAMRECADHHISVKGGSFLEKTAEADTVVFDKTGTLTYSTPRVKEVIPFGGNDSDEMLRLAACLEEHYPHSIANAVVREAEKRGLRHEERHAKVEYIVAHGIASSIDGKKTVIGSHHFVFEDEKCRIPRGETKKFRELPSSCSHLYLAVGGRLAAVILIEDPIRRESREVIQKLKERGISRTVMMTGDSAGTAEAVAAEVGVDLWHAEVLPEDKAQFIRDEHEEGRTVIMLGDGINDSPALAEADCGIAVSDGAAIAREIADVTITDDSLNALLTFKDISDGLNRRIHGNYRFIMTFNTALILLGAFGVLPATTTAYLHNFSTLAVSMKSMTDLLPDA